MLENGPESTDKDTYLVGGSAIPTTTPDPGDLFKYSKARDFQQQALQWLTDRDAPPVAALSAPTGSGKTAVIAAVAKEVDKTVCVYPTNALANAQETALEEEYGLDVQVVTGPTLSGAGTERARELLQSAQRRDQDVFLTNPDILQAVIQNLYTNSGDRIMGLFEQFGAAVYDEFHYYDELAASGLLMQIKVLAERGATIDPRDPDTKRPPRVILSSATPDQSFIEHLREDIELDISPIEAAIQPLDVSPLERSPEPREQLIYQIAGEPSVTARTNSQSIQRKGLQKIDFKTLVEDADPIERFRYPMLIKRHDGWIADQFDAVASRLQQTVDTSYEGGDPIAAVIFNSAARSNAFYKFLCGNYPELAGKTVKDNGYDTGANRQLPDEYAVLNTTSKGEVGLDFDIQRLIMEVPRTATAFIQRIGRAGRDSPAIVDLYGLDDPGWPPVQSYPEFLRRVTETITDQSLARHQLRELIGLRAAWALQSRIDSEWYVPDEMWEDFGDFSNQSRWRNFIEALLDAGELLDTDSIFGPQLDKPASRAVRGAINAVQGLNTLRGRGLQHQVTYPRGDSSEHTEYDLLRALQHYDIDSIGATDTVHLIDNDDQETLRGYYPGKPGGSDGIDLNAPNYDIERALTDGFHAYAQAGSLDETDFNRERLQQFFDVMPLAAALLPREILAGWYTITCNLDRGEVDQIDVSENV